MRLSRKALASVGAVACLSIGGALVYALLPARHAAAPNLVETESRNKADNVTAAPASYDKVPKLGQPLPGRSEEHTSELQSLMRISYAVVCLKKKTDKHKSHQYHTTTASI